MKTMIAKLLVLLSLAATLVGCHQTSYEPTYHYNCYPVYDTWTGYYLYDDCYWEYYNVAGEITNSELDMGEVVGMTEQKMIERAGSYYSEKFSLSVDEGIKVATNARDLSTLGDRSESDIADFAQSLYGVNPMDVVSAVGKAQVGLGSDLDALIDNIDFNTSSENKKALIMELHGNALQANGIDL